MLYHKLIYKVYQDFLDILYLRIDMCDTQQLKSVSIHTLLLRGYYFVEMYSHYCKRYLILPTLSTGIISLLIFISFHLPFFSCSGHFLASLSILFLTILFTSYLRVIFLYNNFFLFGKHKMLFGSARIFLFANIYHIINLLPFWLL